MCMLCVIPPNVLPSREKLENSALNNPDGFGYAIAIPQENRILVHHTMNADEAVNKFLEDKAKYPKGYAIWHARLATQGSNSLENCHPFYVGKDKKSVLAHNGVLPFADEGEKKSLLDRSDTRIFAEHVLPRMGGVSALDDDHMYQALHEITAGSKVAILTVNPVAQYQLYLLHEKSGKYDEQKVWWSNDSCELNYYKSAYSGYTHGGYSSYAWNDDYYPVKPKPKSASNFITIPDNCELEYEPNAEKTWLTAKLTTPESTHIFTIDMKDKNIYAKVSEWVEPLVKKFQKWEEKVQEWEERVETYEDQFYDEHGEVMVRCGVCAHDYAYWDYMFCPNCQACSECLMNKNVCMCYTPRTTPAKGVEA